MNVPFLGFSRVSPTVGLAVLLTVVVCVVLLYLLKPPPQRLEVASLQIWEALARQRSRRKDLWRWLASLLVSTLIAVSLAAAWTGAHRANAGLERPLLVIDTSPTMHALRSDGRSRLEHALDAAERLAAAAVAPVGLTTTASERLRVAHDAESLAAALGELRRELLDPPAGMRRESLGTAGSRGPASSSARFPALPSTPFEAQDVVLLTDGTRTLDAPPGAVVYSVFENVRNVGLRAFEVRSDPANPTAAYIEVHNDSSQAVSAEVVLRTRSASLGSDGSGNDAPTILARQQLSLAPNERWTGRVRLPNTGSATAVEARVETEDDRFAADDSAWVQLQPSRVRVFTDLDRDSAIWRSLAANPRVMLVSVREAAGADLDRRLADVAILGRTTPERRPEVPTLVFTPASVGWLPQPTAGATMLTPASVDFLPGVSPVRELLIESTATWGPLPEGITPVVARLADRREPADTDSEAPTTDDGSIAIGVRLPAIPAREDGTKRAAATVVALGFSLQQSNLTRLPIFPVLLDELVRELAGESLLPATIPELEQGSDSEVASDPQSSSARDPITTASPLPDVGINEQRLFPTARQPESGQRIGHVLFITLALMLVLIEPMLRRWGVTE